MLIKKRKAKWETEIDLQETKTEQSQKLWRTETNIQNSIKQLDVYWFLFIPRKYLVLYLSSVTVVALEQLEIFWVAIP